MNQSLKDRSKRKMGTTGSKNIDPLTEMNTEDSIWYSIFCKMIDEDIVHETTEFFRTLSSNIKIVNIILHVTAGGSVGDCAMLTKLFLNCNRKIIMYVPEIAVSSGTQLALCGSEIIMGKYACLTPIDDQVDRNGDYPIYNIKRIEKDFRRNKFHMLSEYNTILRAKYLRKITKSELNSILREYNKETREKVQKLFLKHELYHEYPIDIHMVQETGLKVSELENEEVWEAFNYLYDRWKLNSK